jgi:hypothetical protein
VRGTAALADGVSASQAEAGGMGVVIFGAKHGL